MTRNSVKLRVALVSVLALAATLVTSILVRSRTVYADVLDELAKLDPFTPQPQIITERPTDRGLWFHNDTNDTIYLSLEYHISGANSISVGEYNLPVVVPDGWMVIGWFAIPPKRSIQVLSGNLDNRYYGFYAHHGNKAWSGGVRNWVDPQRKFSYDSTDKAAAAQLKERGYVLRGFQTIDTGNDMGFTMILRD
jgi:uncharacterized membrane protein